MSALNDNSEITILESKGIQIKNHYYHLVLTSRRLVFDSASDNVHRSIPLTVIQGIELSTDYSGDPVIQVSALSAHGEIKEVILRFSQSDFPDPQQMRSRWYAEIRKRIQQPSQVSPDIPPGNVSPALAFCTKCGKKLVGGSVFCDRCGTRIPFPARPVPPDQQDDRIQERVIRPAVSTGETGLPRKKQSFLYPGDQGTGKKAPVMASLPKEKRKKKSFFSGSPVKKSALIIAVCLASVILVAAVFFQVFPSGLSGFNLTSPGMNVSLPDLSAAAVPFSPDGNTGTNAENPDSAVNPEETSMPESTPVQPALTFAPGDPGAVLSSYPPLFNKGDSASLWDLLSKNMQSQYPLDTLDTEIAAARSNGYSIEKIEVNDQIIEGNNAILVVEISWKIVGSPVTSTPNVPVVYENNRWKLDTLVLHP
jgi:hypothetical protein